MVEKIYNILSTVNQSIPVRYGWYDETIGSTHITFFILMEEPTEFEDDDYRSLNYTIQIDVWSYEDDSAIVKEIKKLMKHNDFMYVSSGDQFEPDTRLYHKAIRYEIIEVEEN